MRLVLMVLVTGVVTVLGCEEPTPCAENAECGDREVCVASECVAAFGQEYTLASGSAEGIPQSHPTEERLWDMPGGFPDPYLIVEEAGGWRCTTYHDSDTLSPSWVDLTCTPTVINDGFSVSWVLYDDDQRDGEELIASSEEGGDILIQAEWLHDGTFTDSAGEVTVSFNFAPVQPEN